MLPSSTRVELRLPALLGALSSVDPFSYGLQINSNSRHGGDRIPGPTPVVVEGNR